MRPNARAAKSGLPNGKNHATLNPKTEMTTTKMTLQQEKWLLGQIKPCPEVFVLAYAGTSYKEWKIVAMCSREEFAKVEDWEAAAKKEFPSATLMRVSVAEATPQPQN